MHPSSRWLWLMNDLYGPVRKMKQDADRSLLEMKAVQQQEKLSLSMKLLCPVGEFTDCYIHLFNVGVEKLEDVQKMLIEEGIARVEARIQSLAEPWYAVLTILGSDGRRYTQECSLMQPYSSTSGMNPG